MNKFLLAFLILSGSLSAEILQVRITWDKMQCERSCIDILKRSIDRYQAVAAYEFNPEKGIAYLRWNPDSPFDLLTIKRIYQTTGLGFGIGDVMIKVSGVIERKGDAFILRSLGDGTRFRLLGPPNPSQTSFHSTGSWQSYIVTPEQRGVLEKAMQESLITVVYGGLYFSMFDYPMIITQDITFPNELPGEK